MPLIRGSNLTHSSGKNLPTKIITDGTSLYTTMDISGSAGGLVKTLISALTETSSVTFNSGENNAIDVALIGTDAFTTHDIASGVTASNAGLVVKTDTSAMTRTSSTQLWSPGVNSLRTSVSIYSDGSFIYVGSGSFSFGGGPTWLSSQVTKMDSSFGTQTTVSLSNSCSTKARITTGDGKFIYVGLAANQSDPSFPFDGVAKLDTSSTLSLVSIFNLPTVNKINAACLIPPKLYIGTTESPGKVYRIDTNSMTLDRVVITLGASDGGIAWIMNSGNILYVINQGNPSSTSSVVFAYDINTYDRIGSLPSIPSQTGPFISSGLFGPNTQGSIQYHCLFGSPGQIQQIKNVYTGSPSTFPSSQQTPFYSSPGGVPEAVPTTKQNIAILTSNIISGFGVSNLIASSNAILQAALMGDPHFYGFEGESFFFNGEVGKCYNLFSDDGIQVNSLFRHWETSSTNNFTAMEEIGITIIIDKIPKIKNSKKKLFKKINATEIKIKIKANGDISVNNEYVCDSLDPILEFVDDLKDYFTDEEIEKFKKTEGYGEFMKANIIRFWPYNFIITRSTDHVNTPYLNIIARLDGNTTNRPHGVIGQTADFDGKPKEKLDGEECDYKVSDLWASDFKFNKFKGQDGSL